MKFVSYLLIASVMGIIAWNTDNAIQEIFESEISTAKTLESLTVQKTEPDTVPSILEDLLGS